MELISTKKTIFYLLFRADKFVLSYFDSRISDSMSTKCLILTYLTFVISEFVFSMTQSTFSEEANLMIKVLYFACQILTLAMFYIYRKKLIPVTRLVFIYLTTSLCSYVYVNITSFLLTLLLPFIFFLLDYDLSISLYFKDITRVISMIVYTTTFIVFLRRIVVQISSTDSSCGL